jgi:probable F420-dependent oxidoreductase
MAYPIRLADHEAILRLALHAEALGFDSVLANDHYSTMPYVRDQFRDPPRFYEPLTTLTYVAARTSRIRLMTGVVVMPMREPVLLAKQVATLDQISGGRFTLGLGVGAYRAEFESVRPDMAEAPRGLLVTEGMASLVELFSQRRASYNGNFYRFSDVELFPKPVQQPFPIWGCGNAEGVIKRAALYGCGWMPAGMPDALMAEAVKRLHQYAEDAGRGDIKFDIAPQLVLCLGRDPAAALETFKGSQAHEHLVSLRNSTLKGFDESGFAAQNLIGSPAQVIDRVAALAECGATEMAGLIVVANSEAEMADQMSMLAEEVMPAFPSQ